MRMSPKICPVCEMKLDYHESGRVLCSNQSCEFEWFNKPLVKIQKFENLPQRSQELLQNENLTNTEFLCFRNGQQGGTIHQIARTLHLAVDQILKAKDIKTLLNAVAEIEN